MRQPRWSLKIKIAKVQVWKTNFDRLNFENSFRIRFLRRRSRFSFSFPIFILEFFREHFSFLNSEVCVTLQKIVFFLDKRKNKSSENLQKLQCL